MFFRGQIIGKYKILSTIGSGGFGTVYLAEDTWIDKKVALKVPHKQGVDFGELLREPRLLASPQPSEHRPHPHRREAGERLLHRDGVRAGRDARGRSSRARARSIWPLALDYTCQICNAVDHAHRQGVLHRDLRPSNVLVSESGLLKVADFGTSRFLEIAAHGTTVIGSPPYMAPEQFHGKAVFASDVYSLGVTMYQMLTGVLPYDTPSPADLDRLMRGELLSPPRLKNPKIPKAINDIVLQGDGAGHSGPLPARRRAARRRAGGAREHAAAGAAAFRRATATSAEDIQTRLKAREAPQPRFCWHCRKPLHARAGPLPVLRRSAVKSANKSPRPPNHPLARYAKISS